MGLWDILSPSEGRSSEQGIAANLSPEARAHMTAVVHAHSDHFGTEDLGEIFADPGKRRDLMYYLRGSASGLAAPRSYDTSDQGTITFAHGVSDAVR